MNELGVDISQGQNISDETLAAWKNAGVKHVYVQYSAKLPYYLDRLEGQGFTVDVYVYLYFPLSPWGQTPESRVETALGMCAGRAVRRVWLDVEDPNDSAPPADVVAALWRCVAAVEARGYEAGIYTGYYTWKSHTDSSEAFARLPLWHADYLGEAPVPDLSLRPAALYFRHGGYFGKTTPDVWQWWNTTMFGGHSVDLDVEDSKEVDMQFVLPTPGVATWWHGRSLFTNPTLFVMNAVTDLGARPGDLVRFQVRLTRGKLRFFHGLTGLEAGECGPGSTTVEAQVSPAGTVAFAVDADAFVSELFGLGYLRS